MAVETGQQNQRTHGEGREGKHRQKHRRECRYPRRGRENGGSEQTHKCQLNANLCVKDFANDRPSAVPIAGPRRLLDQKPWPLLLGCMLRLRYAVYKVLTSGAGEMQNDE